MTDKPSPPKVSQRRILWGAVGLGGAIILAGLLFFLLGGKTAVPEIAVPGPLDAQPPVQAEKRPSSPHLEIEYHYDRNALVDSRRIADRLLALTSAGNVLLFDQASFKLLGERIFHRRVSALGPVDRHKAMIGLENGAILRLDSQDLAVEWLDSVPGAVRWIGKIKGSLLVAYAPVHRETRAEEWHLVQLRSRNQVPIAKGALLFLDSQGNTWVAEGSRIRVMALGDRAFREIPWKSEEGKVSGFLELSDGRIWAYGGTRLGAGFVLRVDGEKKPALLFPGAAGKGHGDGLVRTLLSMTENPQNGVLVASTLQGVWITDRALETWRKLDTPREEEGGEAACYPVGQVHTENDRWVVVSSHGGFTEMIGDEFRRHLLRNQNTILSPDRMVRLDHGLAIYGQRDAGYLEEGLWRALPDAIVPPPELIGTLEGKDGRRSWATLSTFPISGERTYVLAKAGAPRARGEHEPGTQDTFVTAEWDGSALSVRSNEIISIDPEDCFLSPDRQLWSMSERGLWNFWGGRWRLVLRKGEDPRLWNRPVPRAWQGVHGSPLCEPLNIVERNASPFYGIPRFSAAWSFLRIHLNEAGGVPTVDEMPVSADGQRLLIRHATNWGTRKQQILLATDRGLCIHNLKSGGCDFIHPSGLDDEVSLFMRDGTKRLWLGGKGLWVLRDENKADPVHPWIPMLADTRVISLAETLDGRIAVGLEGRGVLLLSFPPGWFSRPGSVSPLAPWEDLQPHEPQYMDPGILLQPCTPVTEAVLLEIASQLETAVMPLGVRTRVEIETHYEGGADLVVRGENVEPLLATVTAVLKRNSRWQFAAYRRFGAKGSPKSEVLGCR